MQIISRNTSDINLAKLLESIKKFHAEHPSTDKKLKFTMVTAAQMVSHAGAVIAYYPLGSKFVVKAIAVPTNLTDVQRTIGEQNNKITLPALPRDLVNSTAFQTKLVTETIAAIKAAEGTKVDKTSLVLLPLVSTPVYLDINDSRNIEEIFMVAYNEIAINLAAASTGEGTLAFKADDKGNREKLVVTADFAGADVVDEFGKDVRADISIRIGKPGKTNDDISGSAESEYGTLNAYMDLMFHTKVIPSQVFGQPAQRINYLPRLVARQFEGPDGHNTMGHVMFSLAMLRSIYQEANIATYAFYPDYSLPKDAVNLRNIGALAADTALTLNDKNEPILEYVPLHAIKDPKAYHDMLPKLIQQDLRVGVSLRPYQMRGATQRKLMAIAANNDVDALTDTIKEISALCDNKFPAQKYLDGKAKIFEPNSITTKYAGEFYNSITGRWEDLSRLDGIAAFNFLCSNGKLNPEYQQRARAYLDSLNPQGNNPKVQAEIWESLKAIVGGSKNLRINDYEYIPLFTKVFLDDLSDAINRVTDLSVKLNAPHVVAAEERGQSTYNFGNTGSFAGHSGGFGSSGNTGGFGDAGFGNFGSSW